MAYVISCPKCGRSAKSEIDPGGRKVRCNGCGEQFWVPREEGDAIPLVDPEPPPIPLLPRSKIPAAMPTPSRPGAPRKPKAAARDADGGAKGPAKKVLTFVFALWVLSALAYRIYKKTYNSFPHGDPAPTAAASFATGAADAQVPLPAFPNIGPGRELEPGVVLHEMQLPGGRNPGDSGKLWLYLPAGEHANRSLSCVMITGAGSNLITGMKLGDGDRPEHLPYVRAGFAVLAYELDGALEQDNPSDAQFTDAARKFLAARAGLANAHVALEFLRAKVPQVDPGRIFAAGHSSAGTAALLFAEHEPALRGCAAYAPAVDLAKRFGPVVVADLRATGLGDLADRYARCATSRSCRAPSSSSTPKGIPTCPRRTPRTSRPGCGPRGRRSTCNWSPEEITTPA